MTTSQSTAFQIDHLLESSPSESPKPAPELPRPGPSYERSPFPYPPSRPTNEPIFTGRLPPPPVIGRAAAPAIPPISVGALGISVSTLVIHCLALLNFSNPLLCRDVDLGRFAVPDEFERSIIANPVSVGDSASRSGHVPLAGPSSDPSPNAKRSRKLGPDSQRRKARGLFPNDNVPLALVIIYLARITVGLPLFGVAFLPILRNKRVIAPLEIGSQLLADTKIPSRRSSATNPSTDRWSCDDMSVRFMFLPRHWLSRWDSSAALRQRCSHTTGNRAMTTCCARRASVAKCFRGSMPCADTGRVFRPWCRMGNAYLVRLASERRSKLVARL